MSLEEENELFRQYLDKNYKIMELENDIEQIHYKIYTNPAGLKQILGKYRRMPYNACGKYTSLSLRKSVPSDLTVLLAKNIHGKQDKTSFEPICLVNHIQFTDEDKKVLQFYNLDWCHKIGKYLSSD